MHWAFEFSHAKKQNKPTPLTLPSSIRSSNSAPHWSLEKTVTLSETHILLMVQKSGIHQLRLVVFPISCRVLYIPVGSFILHPWIHSGQRTSTIHQPKMDSVANNQASVPLSIMWKKEKPTAGIFVKQNGKQLPAFPKNPALSRFLVGLMVETSNITILVGGFNPFEKY